MAHETLLEAAAAAREAMDKFVVGVRELHASVLQRERREALRAKRERKRRRQQAGRNR